MSNGMTQQPTNNLNNTKQLLLSNMRAAVAHARGHGRAERYVRVAMQPVSPHARHTAVIETTNFTALFRFPSTSMYFTEDYTRDDEK
jgi:hypothetical protein